MENTNLDYAGLVALVVGVSFAVWYFWGKIKNRMDK